MKRTMRSQKGVSLWWALPVLMVVLYFTVYTKTVEWEEEVPLNTGETIWVKRTVVYTLRGTGPLALTQKYVPDWNEKLAFKWRGKEYVYEGDADLMLIAISPYKDVPILVAPARNKNWDFRHGYKCAKPHYVQFSPGLGGREWVWPLEIEKWLYNLPSNLMRDRKDFESMRSRYTALDREEADKSAVIFNPKMVRVDPNYLININECPGM